MSYQLMPQLSADDFAALKTDIAARGVLVPVEYDEAGAILDGHHRVRACEELGLLSWPKLIREGFTEEEKRVHARQLNLARRHLTPEQRRQLIADQLRETPEQSNRQIAADLGVDDKTVGAVRTTMEATAEIPQLPATVGRDGKARSKPRKRKVMYVDDSPAGVAGAKERAKDVRASENAERREQRTALLDDLSNRNAPLPNRRYPVIYADPPWEYDFSPSSGRAVENHYPTMPIEEIVGLDVSGIATPDAMLFLWAPPSFIKKGIMVLEAWGFELATSMVWVKDKIGTGIYVRQRHEYLLLGKREKPITPVPGTQPDSVISAPRGKHSEKPEDGYLVVERMYPALAKIELFSRSPRAGWDAWGNQAGVAQ